MEYPSISPSGNKIIPVISSSLVSESIIAMENVTFADIVEPGIWLWHIPKCLNGLPQELQADILASVLVILDPKLLLPGTTVEDYYVWIDFSLYTKVWANCLTEVLDDQDSKIH